MNNFASQPLVSVGIPTYNRPEGLRRTLECITGQTYKNLEIIVSDNWSPTSETDLVANEFVARDPRVSYFKQTRNSGASENFRFVLRRARGKYFMWAADDDEWDRDFILSCMEAGQTGGSVMCEFETIFRIDGRVSVNPTPSLSGKASRFLDASEFLRIMQPSLFYGLHRRSDIQFFLTDEYFDFYDCYFVLRLILTSGYRTTKGALYRAGVDSPEYKVKTMDTTRTRSTGDDLVVDAHHQPVEVTRGRLQYVPFVRRSIGVIFSAEGLSYFHRLVLVARFFRMLGEIFAHHESRNRPFAARMAAFLLGSR